MGGILITPIFLTNLINKVTATYSNSVQGKEIKNLKPRVWEVKTLTRQNLLALLAALSAICVEKRL